MSMPYSVKISCSWMRVPYKLHNVGSVVTLVFGRSSSVWVSSLFITRGLRVYMNRGSFFGDDGGCCDDPCVILKKCQRFLDVVSSLKDVIVAIKNGCHLECKCVDLISSRNDVVVIVMADTVAVSHNQRVQCLASKLPWEGDSVQQTLYK
jgi:hypothetical protein